MGHFTILVCSVKRRSGVADCWKYRAGTVGLRGVIAVDLLRRRRAVTSTLLAQLLNVTRINLSNQFQDGHRLLDLHRIAVTPLPGTPARTLAQLQTHLPSRDDTCTDQL